MPFSAPDLKTSVTNKTDINTNFALIETALFSIQNELPYINSQSQATNFTWIERAIRPEGVIGREAFTISLNTDGDTFSIEHDTTSGYSSCVITNRYHETNATFTKAFSELCAIDGTYELAFGVKSRGAPVCEMKLVIDGTDVDLDLDLVVWRFNVTRDTSTYTVTNLRRVQPVILNLQSFSDVYEFQHPLTWSYAGTLPTTTGAFGTGFCVPWDCEVEGAYMRLETAPALTDGISIDIYQGSGTDASSVLSDLVNFSTADSGVVKTAGGYNPRVQIAAGSYLHPYLALTENPSTAANLSITLMLRAIYQPIY